jgi:hypothetical protein
MSEDGNLSGALPKGDANGLGPIVRTLIDEPHRYHVLMAIVDCAKVTTNNDTGEIIPTARISSQPLPLRLPPQRSPRGRPSRRCPARKSRTLPADPSRTRGPRRPRLHPVSRP